MALLARLLWIRVKQQWSFCSGCVSLFLGLATCSLMNIHTLSHLSNGTSVTHHPRGTFLSQPIFLEHSKPIYFHEMVYLVYRRISKTPSPHPWPALIKVNGMASINVISMKICLWHQYNYNHNLSYSLPSGFARIGRESEEENKNLPIYSAAFRIESVESHCLRNHSVHSTTTYGCTLSCIEQ